MSRIRSVHPGLWTDERFASVSPLARLLLIGIWNECDDSGSFEWSPLKLKMRILPGDAADAVPLLEELEAAGCVKSYELDGRQLGAVRNFMRYQRPKKPNSIYPQTDAIRNYVGTEARSTRDGSEAVGNQDGTDTEKRRQMEEEGDKGKERKKEVTAPNGAAPFAFEGTIIRLNKHDFDQWVKAYPALDLPAVLQSRDDWLVNEADEKVKKKWFISTSNHLANLQQKATSAAHEAFHDRDRITV